MSAVRRLITLWVLAGLILASALPAQAESEPSGGSSGGECSSANNTCSGPSECGSDPCPSGNSTSSASEGNSTSRSGRGDPFGVFALIESRGPPKPDGGCEPVDIRHPKAPQVSVNPLLGYVYVDFGCVDRVVGPIVAVTPPSVQHLYQTVARHLRS